MTLQRRCPCKINLLLNILGRRADGFHELETILQPVPVHDVLEFRAHDRPGIELTCNHPDLPTDGSNLVRRAAERFFERSGLREGVRIHLEKRVPMAAGLGGGSSNAAQTLLGLNAMFNEPLGMEELQSLAAALGSDVPFFLQEGPALALGRGERIQSLPPFAALRGAFLFLVHPGFGISTPWAYRELARFPAALQGTPGRAEKLATLLQSGDLAAAGAAFYNSLEAPALEKYPILALYQEFLREHRAVAALMSGSGSSTFGIFQDRAAAVGFEEQFKERFGTAGWTAVVPF
jgi:4-diphosphocytidyl-2-C-methyl-D-erythritol kinase